MPTDPYLYPGTSVLLNKAGIRDQDALTAHEYEMVASRACEAFQYAERSKKLGEMALQNTHRILFSDVYDWAGQFRTIHLSKEGSRFVEPAHLEGAMNRRILPAFRRAIGDSTISDRRIEAFSHCWAEMNRLHPFREGNGRATQIFLSALARRHGCEIDWRKVSYEDEIAAAKASMHDDERLFGRILQTALLLSISSRQITQFWPTKPWPPDGTPDE